MNIRNTKPLLPARGGIMLSPRNIFLALGRRTVKSRSGWTFVVLLLVPMLAFSHGDTPFSAADVIHACKSPIAGVLRKIDTGNCHPTEAVVHWNVVGPQGVAGPPGPAGTPGSSAPTSWDHMSTAAATGYCLAKHPYQYLLPGIGATAEYPRGFTPDGYELVPSPGVVGAVRRNYVHSRTTEIDEGASNSCPQACQQFGKYWRGNGTPLHQKLNETTIITSGIGDMASLAIADRDFYLGLDVIAGIGSRGNTWHESDVAQADFCCCAVQ